MKETDEGESQPPAESAMEDNLDSATDAWITGKIASSKFFQVVTDGFLRLENKFPGLAENLLKINLTLKSLGSGAAIGFLGGFQDGFNDFFHQGP